MDDQYMNEPSTSVEPERIPKRRGAILYSVTARYLAGRRAVSDRD